MIRYEPRGWVRILLRLRGSVIPRIAVRIVVVTLIALAVTYLHRERGVALAIPVTVHTIVGVALGLLLVFRTNASYDRFWEGRKLLGSMVNTCRDLARQTRSYLPAERREVMGRYIVALFVTIRRYLRQEGQWPELADRLSAAQKAELAAARTPPLAVARWMSDVLAGEVQAGRVSDMQVRMIDENITRTCDQWGGAERILNTPVPFAYAHHIKGFLTLFCFTVPLALLDSMGWYTPAASAIVAYAMFGIDEIGVEIEDPFGYDENDLPLDDIGDTVARNVADLLGSDTEIIQ